MVILKDSLGVLSTIPVRVAHSTDDGAKDNEMLKKLFKIPFSRRQKTAVICL